VEPPETGPTWAGRFPMLARTPTSAHLSVGVRRRAIQHPESGTWGNLWTFTHPLHTPSTDHPQSP
jgi:hypothetical protein